jgi:rRNA-processing protein FCF1
LAELKDAPVVKVLVDTSFLMAAARFRKDAVQQLERMLGGRVEPILLSAVQIELDAIASDRRAKRFKEANLALELAKSFAVEQVSRRPGESVDDTLLRVALERGMTVATNDRQLRKRLDQAAVATIYLRQRSRIEARGLVG